MVGTRYFWPACGVIAAIVAIVVPLFGSAAAMDIGFRIYVLVMISVSWNLMAGAGLVSLGHSGFWGLGSYAAVLVVNKLGWSFGASLMPAALCGAVIGVVLGLITGRLRGIYFAISTLAMSEGLRVVAVMLPDFTGGMKGQYLDSSKFPGIVPLNVVAATCAIAMVLVAWQLSRTRYHFGLRAMRNNEGACQMLGVAPLPHRLGIIAISGAMAGLAGGISVWRGGYLDPEVAFDLTNTINSQIAPIIGGIYTLPGPIIGSVLTVFLGEATRLALGNVVGASLLLYGVLLVVIVLVLPNGVCGFLLGQKQTRRPFWLFGRRRSAPQVTS